MKVQDGIFYNTLGGLGFLSGVLSPLLDNPMSLVSFGGGVVLMFYSIRNARMDYKIKKRKLEQMDIDNKENKEL